MNIAHVNLQDGWRGGEQQVGFLMQELQKKSIRQILVCLENSALEQFARNHHFEVFPLKRGLLGKLSNLRRFANFLTKNHIDIIHCNESKGLGLAVWSGIIFGKRAKLILHRHVAFPVKGLWSKLTKYSPRFNDKCICISTEGERIFRASTYNTNITIAPSMTDVDYTFKNESILLDRGVNTQLKIIGYFAAFTPEKDHETFLNTAHRIIQKRQDIHFVLAGSGILEDDIKAKALALNIEKHITFLGFVPQAQRLIAEIDLLLFTSNKEGLGSTIQEFFVAKKPVVTVKNGGSEDLVIEGKTGFICEIKDDACLADKVLLLLDNPTLTAEITQNAYDFIRSGFSFEKVTEKIYTVYQEVLKKS